MRKIPRQARARHTVDAILTAATQILERGGPITTDAIADRAGVSVSSLYQYFENKIDVLDTVVESETNRLIRVAFEAIRTADPNQPRELVASIVAALFDAFGGRQSVRARLRTFLDSEERSGPVLNQAVGQGLELLASRGFPVRVVSPGERFFLVASVEGAIRAWAAEPDRRALQNELELLVVDFVYGTLFGDR